MKQVLLFILLSISTVVGIAQTHLTIYHQIKGIVQIDITTTDSVTFASNGDITVHQGNQQLLFEKSLIDSLHHFNKFTGIAEIIYAGYPGNITGSSALLKATIIHNSSSLILQKGFILGDTDSCTLFKNIKVIPAGYGKTNFTAQVKNLNCDALYYVKAYMIAGEDTSYSAANYFNTKSCPVFVADSTNSLTALLLENYKYWDPNGWGNGTLTGADSSSGYTNTANIVGSLQAGNYAAYHCDTLEAFGKNDWYLPSIEELNLLYQSKDQLGNYSTSSFWSSTEHDRDLAIVLRFSTGIQTTANKTNSNYVACVRKQNDLPVIKTIAYDSLNYFSAVINGKILSSGSTSITEKGVLLSTKNNLSIDNYEDKFTSPAFTDSLSIKLTGLNGNQKYYARYYAKNDSGYNYGQVISFTTLNPNPYIRTDVVTNITGHSATPSATIFLHDTLKILEKGFVYGLKINPTIDSSYSQENRDSILSDTIIFSSWIGLQDFVSTYYVRAYAKNKYGITYGNNLIFDSRTDTVITDIEGNIYGTVKIGNQVWMNENLRVGKFNDGSEIKRSGQIWGEYANFPNHAFYNNNEYEYGVKFGAIYNEKVVHTNKNVCPSGWKIPSAADWDELINYLGGNTIAGEKMKAITKYWNSSYNFATDESGFRGMPGGNASYNANYVSINNVASWWSSSFTVGYGNQPALIYSLFVQNKNATQREVSSNLDGYYIRCIRK